MGVWGKDLSQGSAQIEFSFSANHLKWKTTSIHFGCKALESGGGFKDNKERDRRSLKQCPLAWNVAQGSYS